MSYNFSSYLSPLARESGSISSTYKRGKSSDLFQNEILPKINTAAEYAKIAEDEEQAALRAANTALMDAYERNKMARSAATQAAEAARRALGEFTEEDIINFQLLRDAQAAIREAEQQRREEESKLQAVIRKREMEEEAARLWAEAKQQGDAAVQKRDDAVRDLEQNLMPRMQQVTRDADGLEQKVREGERTFETRVSEQHRELERVQEEAARAQDLVAEAGRALQKHQEDAANVRAEADKCKAAAEAAARQRQEDEQAASRALQAADKALEKADAAVREAQDAVRAKDTACEDRNKALAAAEVARRQKEADLEAALRARQAAAMALKTVEECAAKVVAARKELEELEAHTNQQKDLLRMVLHDLERALEAAEKVVLAAKIAKAKSDSAAGNAEKVKSICENTARVAPRSVMVIC